MDDPHIKAFDNVADKLDRIEELLSGVVQHLKQYELDKTSGSVCGHLFGLNFPIKIRPDPDTNGTAFFTLVSITGSQEPERTLTDTDFRTYLSDEAYAAWKEHLDMSLTEVGNSNSMTATFPLALLRVL
jgi:hypothetical protein